MGSERGAMAGSSEGTPEQIVAIISRLLTDLLARNDQATPPLPRARGEPNRNFRLARHIAPLFSFPLACCVPARSPSVPLRPPPPRVASASSLPCLPPPLLAPLIQNLLLSSPYPFHPHHTIHLVSLSLPSFLLHGSALPSPVITSD